ncbi:hypothetical protein BpHYR1_042201 [Brachionus plicatilis]|uniref:Uncharacterized protein n=1 Tax=Brachionus plicatilis TaxID=10195 RepID=A0A3M7SH55_BRAPC|nr:hypothetical protein BpHYR1_042201 [Brachionus plicatilis]
MSCFHHTGSLKDQNITLKIVLQNVSNDTKKFYLDNIISNNLFRLICENFVFIKNLSKIPNSKFCFADLQRLNLVGPEKIYHLVGQIEVHDQIHNFDNLIFDHLIMIMNFKLPLVVFFRIN